MRVHAAVPRGEAAAAVQSKLPEGWSAELVERWLTREQVALLNLRPGDVREMTS